MHRMLFVAATKQWCAPMITDEAFSDDGKAWADRVAATLGLQAGSLTVVDNVADLRTGALLAEPVSPKIVTPTAVPPVQTLVKLIAAASDLASLKQAISADPALSKLIG